MKPKIKASLPTCVKCGCKAPVNAKTNKCISCDTSK